MLHKVLARRLVGYIIKNKLVSFEQGGYLWNEEVSNQIASLLEIVWRRRRAGRETFALFVDLKKAFDSVDHDSLFDTIEKIGIDKTNN